MRVTEKMIFDSSLAQAEKSRENLAQAQEQVASGSRVEQPGDDPVASALAIGQMVDKAKYTAIGNTAQQAADELGSADTALGTLSTLTNRALQLATQFGNDTYSATDRSAAGVEVNQLFQQAVDLLNTTYNGRYIFGGFKDSSPPFASDGSYTGDDNVRKVEIAPGLYQAASVDANKIVKGSAGGVDLMATLTQLATDLNNNDGSAIRGQISNLTAAVAQLAAGRTQVGMSQDAFQSAVSTSQSVTADQTAKIGKLLDADVLDASSKLASAQYALNATLTATAKTLTMSLADKLG